MLTQMLTQMLAAASK